MRAAGARAGAGAAPGVGASPTRGPPPAYGLPSAPTALADLGTLLAEHSPIRPGRRAILKLQRCRIVRNGVSVVEVHGEVTLDPQQAARFGVPTRRVSAVLVTMKQDYDRLREIALATGGILWCIATSLAPRTEIDRTGRRVRRLKGRVALKELFADREEER